MPENNLESASPRPKELDDLDLKIMRMLAEDARLSVRAISRDADMSPGAISDRIARLERLGAIKGYHAEIDPVVLGFGLEAIIGLQTVQGPSLANTLDRLMDIPEIESVSVVTGQWDLFAKARVRDHQHLRDVILDRIWGMPAFSHSETMVVYEVRRRSSESATALSLSERFNA